MHSVLVTDHVALSNSSINIYFLDPKACIIGYDFMFKQIPTGLLVVIIGTLITPLAKTCWDLTFNP